VWWIAPTDATAYSTSRCALELSASVATRWPRRTPSEDTSASAAAPARSRTSLQLLTRVLPSESRETTGVEPCHRAAFSRRAGTSRGVCWGPPEGVEEEEEEEEEEGRRNDGSSIARSLFFNWPFFVKPPAPLLRRKCVCGER